MARGTYARSPEHRAAMAATIQARTPNIYQRMWAKVRRAGPDDCWLWSGGVSGNGYGNALRDRGRGVRIAPHCLAYMFGGVRIPPHKEVRHTCDVRLCCNPRHLIIGTHAENQADMARRGRARNRYTARKAS